MPSRASTTLLPEVDLTTSELTTARAEAAAPRTAPADEVRLLRAAAGPVGRVVFAAEENGHHKALWEHVPMLVRRSIVPVLLVLAWQAGSSWNWWTSSVLPSPVNVAQTFWQLLENGQLLPNLWVSFRRVLIGSALGVTTGTVLGVLVGLWRFPEEALDATLQMMRTLPYLVMLPLFIVWFGVDELPKILIIAIGTSLPIYLNASSGVRQVDPRLKEMASTFGLKKRALIGLVIIPGALPSILTGLRYSLGVGWLALVVAEQINARAGLGLLISNAENLFQTNILMVCVVIYAALGLTTDIMVRALDRVLLRWRGNQAR
jgi:sulfonate transport system permease protein